ncbi:MAG: hypothetical protein ABR540_11925 [Acidimicrobiales bacterium]|nr:hypothetical protein [Actinomycetota bacterium]
MTVARRARLAALALPLTLVLAACGGDDEPSTPSSGAGTTAAAPAVTPAAGPATSTTAPAAVSFTVSGGSVEGPSRHTVELGDQVFLRVTSDEADELHVHGYDHTAAVGPGKIAELRFPADIPGVFEVELEHSRRRVTTLEVRP